MLLFSSVVLHSQADPYFLEEDIEEIINQALDFFSNGEYLKAIEILSSVLLVEPANKRASDLIKSIGELYEMEIDSSDGTGQDYITERPDFSINDPLKKEEPADEDLEKPDFSVRDDEDNLLLPEHTRTVLEFSLSPNLVLPWEIGEESVVFPDESDYAGSFNAEVDFFFNSWNRIFGISGAYSLFLLNPDEEEFASNQLHVFDAMFNFRTFFSETVDSKIIFKLALGYRGYFSRGYDFYTIDRTFLNGFNMGINLEAPLLYLFWEEEFLKRLVFDVDMNLLFFPEVNTLNLIDFTVNSSLRFNHFSAGIHFGAYSVITPDKVEYMWMTGLNINLFF
jgi:hypothetical protein